MRLPPSSLFRRMVFRMAFAICILLIIVGVFFFVGAVPEAAHMEWGITFSHRQAEDLGLDWQETYNALLDDAGVRNVRIPIYWDEMERQIGVFDFSAWDWQLQELEKRGGKATLVIGFKVPRWPECHFPSWVDASKREVWEPQLFRMLREVTMRYKDTSAVQAWQVENEPLLSFGICPPADAELLDAELKLVRSIDPSRPIVLTDSGENSSWFQMSKRADIFGASLYRVAYNPKLRTFIDYPYPAVMYARKKMLMNLFFPQVRFMFSEVQAEPWVSNPPIQNSPLEEQYRTMSPEKFRAVIAYTRQTGFDTAYLWGAEWWYWAKIKGNDPRIWNEAKNVFMSK